jgi:hypothetical protein
MVYGGFLIWRLYPDYRVMFDGRLEIFGPERFRELQIDSTERFEALDAKYRFGVVVQRYGPGGGIELLAHWIADPEWRLVAVDDAAALFPGRRLRNDLGAPGSFRQQRQPSGPNCSASARPSLGAGRDLPWRPGRMPAPFPNEQGDVRRTLLESLGRADAKINLPTMPGTR